MSHGPRKSETGETYAPNGVYSELNAYLRQQMILIDLNVQPDLSLVDVSAYQALVINELSAWDREYSIQESETIRAFVQNGGGVLIMAEAAEFSNHVGPVAAAFGIQTGLEGSIDTLASFTDHPIVAGVGQVEFLFGGGGLEGTDPSVMAVAGEGDAPGVIAVGELPGRVVVIGDTNLFDNRGLPLSDNRIFALRVFRWLTFLD